MANIRDLIIELIKNNEEAYSVLAKVLSVDKDQRTCELEPLDGSAKIFDARLQSVVKGGAGLVLFPVVGSDVVASFLSKELVFISKTSEIEEVFLNIGGLSMFLDSENFNKSVKNVTIETEEYQLTGKNTKFELSELFEVKTLGQFNIEAIVAAITAPNISLNGAVTIAGSVAIAGGLNGGVPMSAALKTEIDKLITEVNKITGVLKGWSPVSNDGGAALKAASSILSDLSPVIESNISNPNVTH